MTKCRGHHTSCSTSHVPALDAAIVRHHPRCLCCRPPPCAACMCASENTSTGHSLTIFRAVKDFAFAESGDLYSASWDHSIRRWRVPPDADEGERAEVEAVFTKSPVRAPHATFPLSSHAPSPLCVESGKYCYVSDILRCTHTHSLVPSPCMHRGH